MNGSSKNCLSSDYRNNDEIPADIEQKKKHKRKILLIKIIEIALLVIALIIVSFVYSKL